MMLLVFDPSRGGRMHIRLVCHDRDPNCVNLFLCWSIQRDRSPDLRLSEFNRSKLWNSNTVYRMVEKLIKFNKILSQTEFWELTHGLFSNWRLNLEQNFDRPVGCLDFPYLPVILNWDSVVLLDSTNSQGGCHGGSLSSGNSEGTYLSGAGLLFLFFLHFYQHSSIFVITIGMAFPRKSTPTAAIKVYPRLYRSLRSEMKSSPKTIP